jgi:hypothetical protein
MVQTRKWTKNESIIDNKYSYWPDVVHIFLSHFSTNFKEIKTVIIVRIYKINIILLSSKQIKTSIANFRSKHYYQIYLGRMTYGYSEWRRNRHSLGYHSHTIRTCWVANKTQSRHIHYKFVGPDLVNPSKMFGRCDVRGRKTHRPYYYANSSQNGCLHDFDHNIISFSLYRNSILKFASRQKYETFENGSTLGSTLRRSFGIFESNRRVFGCIGKGDDAHLERKT